MSQHERRHSSEYSVGSSEFKLENKKAEIEDDIKQNLRSRGELYGLLFGNWKAKVGVIPSMLMGTTPIVIYLIFGNVLNAHTDYAQGKNPNALKDIATWCLWIVFIAVVSSICRFLSSFIWIRVGSEFALQIRKDLFRNMMRSEVAFFDTNPVGNILTLLSEDAQLVQEAFGTTKSTQFHNLAQFLAGIILSFVYSWKMALIILCIVPFSVLTIYTFSQFIDRHINLAFFHVAESMTIAEETLSSIRTVRGCNREDQEIKRFQKETIKNAHESKVVGALVVTMFSIVITALWAFIVGNLYYGGTMVDKGDFKVGNLFSVFGFMMFGIMGIIELQGSLQGEQKAIASGARILKLTYHVPELPFSGGEIIEDFKGHISFRNVSFKYPTRDVYVLKNVSFEVLPGQMGALVGHSGSGKSTCVQLLERFYDATEGIITLDGKDIKTLDPQWLHRKMALVSQEPILFQTTIKENIKYGARDANEEQVRQAAEIANALKFIDKLDKGLETMVGEKGAALSGGQRQRIAIARAVIKDPVVLITDEATSALDAGSEKKVQLALDKVMENRTAVIVAHRLSTIRNAHIIYVFDAGEIKEIGTHDELVKKGGYYYELVRRQLTKEDEEKKKNNQKKLETNSTSSSEKLDGEQKLNDNVELVNEEEEKPKKSKKSSKKKSKSQKKGKSKKSKKKKTDDSDTSSNSLMDM